jgi:glycosyltransferase involved in cell wall biosynthesis
MKNSSVTVITAVYNAERFLRETVESVASQTLLPNEHLLIDDCSTDCSLDLARQLEREYPHVRVVEHERNMGFPAALNTGIAESVSDYIGILDSDDVALPHWLESVVPVLESDPQVGSAGGGGVIMTENGVVTGYIKYCDQKGDVTAATLDGVYPMLHPGTVHRRAYLEEIGGYNCELKSGEDNDVYLGISSIAKLINIGIPLVNYRRLPGSESRKTEEFRVAMYAYLETKSKLLKEGQTVADTNKQLVSHVAALKNAPRLAFLTKGAYEFEMASAFEEGNQIYQAIMKYILVVSLGYERRHAVRGILRCLIPKKITQLIQVITFR